MNYIKCRSCNQTYEELPYHKDSKKMEHYVKAYLGFCSNKCYDKLDKKSKAIENMLVSVYGTGRKDNNFKIK
mgnify:FL=1|jgi:hypothetical protein